MQEQGASTVVMMVKSWIARPDRRPRWGQGPKPAGTVAECHIDPPKHPGWSPHECMRHRQDQLAPRQQEDLEQVGYQRISFEITTACLSAPCAPDGLEQVREVGAWMQTSEIPGLLHCRSGWPDAWVWADLATVSPVTTGDSLYLGRQKIQEGFRRLWTLVHLVYW